jgi:hypothetical protein
MVVQGASEIAAAVLDHLPAGLSGVVSSGSGDRYSPEVAAVLLGSWAVGALAVGIFTLHRRDPDHGRTRRHRLDWQRGKDQA